MDVPTFLDGLKQAAKASPADGFYEFFESNYPVYLGASPEDRKKMRGFVISPDAPARPASFLDRIFSSQPKDNSLLRLLLMEVRQRALPQLKETGDPLWLYRGLTAIALEDMNGGFDDPDYTQYPGQADALFLLADLYVTAEEKGLDPEPIFKEVAEAASARPSAKYIPMGLLMSGMSREELVHERREHGRFVGMFQ